jgi:hypothetical protein
MNTGVVGAVGIKAYQSGIYPESTGFFLPMYHFIPLSDGKDTYHVQIISITPASAEACLKDRNVDNFRKITPRFKKSYIDDMRKGRWNVDGAAIVFAPDGKLVDGQKRLAACTDGSVSFTTFVIVGVRPTLTTDTGEKRTLNQYLQNRGEKYYHALGAAITCLKRYQDRSNIFSTTNLYSTSEYLALLDRNPGLRESVAYITGTQINVGHGPSTVIHYLACQHGLREQADAFFRDLDKGERLQEGDPVYALRKEITERFRTNKRMGFVEKFAKGIKAWNYRLANKPTKFIRFSLFGEHASEFPVLEFQEF